MTCTGEGGMLEDEREASDTLVYQMTPSRYMLDLDHLREYNAEFGHLMGSRVLAHLGKVLRQSIRDDDYVAKYGGDEFLVILPGSSKAHAVEIALRLKAHIARQTFYGVSAGYITCSFGVATFGDDGTSFQSLVGSADRAIYSAKEMGRNAVVAAGREKTGDTLHPAR